VIHSNTAPALLCFHQVRQFQLGVVACDGALGHTEELREVGV
jgi:hypothetical protein